MLSRTDNSKLSRWWWTIDRPVFLASVGLLLIGVLLAFAASPAATEANGKPGNFSFAIKHLVFAVMAFVLLIGTSMLNNKQAQIGRAHV